MNIETNSEDYVQILNLSVLGCNVAEWYKLLLNAWSRNRRSVLSMNIKTNSEDNVQIWNFSVLGCNVAGMQCSRVVQASVKCIVMNRLRSVLSMNIETNSED